jgi:hypothetical protein
MAEQEFEPQIRLIFQGSVPCPNIEEGADQYRDLAIFIKAISKKATLNGQLIMMLEPCCNKSKPPAAEQPGFTQFSPANPKGETVP